MIGHTQKRQVARGVPHSGGKRGVVVYLDNDTFATIRARAVKLRTSFGEQVRILIEWGLEEDDEGVRPR